MLAVAVVLMVATGPGQTVGVSVFVNHFIADLDLTRSQVATAYLIGTLAGATAMPVVGRLIDRRGVRLMATAVIASFVFVLCGMSAVAGFATLTIGFAGIRGLGQGSLSLISSTTVAVWFDRRRGTAIGLLSAVGGAGMALIPLIGAVMIDAWGWRSAWIGLAAVVALLALPLAVFVLRDPRLEGTVSTDIEMSVEPDVGTVQIWTSRKVLRHPAFWAILLSSACAGMLSTALVFHQVDVLGARGLTDTQAAANFLPQTLAAAGGALVIGRLADRHAPRHLLAASLVVLAAPTLMWHVVSPGFTAVLYGILIGSGGSAIRTIEGSTLPKWYGIAAIGEIRGIVATTNVAASAVGPVALSLGRDVFGSYGATLLGLGMIPIVLAMYAVSVHPPSSVAERIAVGSR